MFSWHRHTHTQSLAKNCHRPQEGPMPTTKLSKELSSSTNRTYAKVMMFPRHCHTHTQSLAKNCCHSQKGPMQSCLIAHHNRTSTNDCHNPQEKDICQRLSPFTTKPASTNDCHNPQEKDTCQQLSPITTKPSLTLVAIHQKRTSRKDYSHSKGILANDRHQPPTVTNNHKALANTGRHSQLRTPGKEVHGRRKKCRLT